MQYVESRVYLEAAEQRGINFDLESDSRVVVTGYAAISPFGYTWQTWNGFKEGRSAVTTLDTGNQYSRLAAPLPQDYKPGELLPREDRKRMSRLSAMSVVAAREAGWMAGLLNERGYLDTNLVHPYRAGTWIASGITETPRLIDVYLKLHQRDSKGVEDLSANSRRMDLELTLSVFPEEMNGDTARLLGLSGWGGNSAEACATGASNIVEGARLIKEGRLRAVFCGGFEDALYYHPEIVHGIFASGLHALSTRNDEPEKASRPFDKDRDGFVPGSGGGVVVLEREDCALVRGAKILAEVTGFAKSMDGSDKTALNPVRVADTVAESLWDNRTSRFRKPDVIFAHATSTPLGDKLEAQALRYVFGGDLKDIPVTALKAYIGHLLGGSGPVNVVTAVEALNEGFIPPILNLDNPDPEITAAGPMDFVRGNGRNEVINSILALAYGFGGYNASLVLERYKG